MFMGFWVFNGIKGMRLLGVHSVGTGNARKRTGTENKSSISPIPFINILKTKETLGQGQRKVTLAYLGSQRFRICTYVCMHVRMYVKCMFMVMCNM